MRLILVGQAEANFTAVCEVKLNLVYRAVVRVVHRTWTLMP